MPVASKILKNFNLFVDGRGNAGNIEELKLPTLSLKDEEFRAGGMDAPISVEMGQEKMEASFILTGYDSATLALWGVGPQSQVPLVARGALESLDGSVEQVKVTMSGTVKSVEPGAWKAGEKSSLTFTVSLRAYKFEQGGVTIDEIDVINFVRTIGGTDRLAAQRNAIGI